MPRYELKQDGLTDKALRAWHILSTAGFLICFGAIAFALFWPRIETALNANIDRKDQTMYQDIRNNEANTVPFEKGR